MTWARYFCVAILLPLSLSVSADTPVFEIGKFSLDPRKQIPQIQPMADFLANQMQPFGYESGRASVFANFDSARQALSEGGLDMMTTSLYEAAQMIVEGEAVPLAVKWKNGLSEYSSLIVVNADSDIYELEDLAGKTIAFEDPGSTSAFFIPYMALQNSNLSLSEIGSGSGNQENTVSYRFTGAEQNSSVILFQNKVDAIALSDYDWLKNDHVPAAQKENFRIIWISDPYPSAMEIISTGIPTEQRAYLRNALVRLHLSEDGQKVLDEYHETSRFSRLPDEIREQLDSFTNFLATGQFLIE